MKKLMILGSEKYFENLVVSAKQKNIYTIVCDGLGDTPAKKIADEAIEVDVYDIDKLVVIAKEKNIDGIITGFSDVLIKPYTIIANQLGIPCVIKENQLEAITNKKVMKKIFEDNDILSPKYYIIEDKEKNISLKDFIFPLIIKPLDSSGSKGIYIVQDMNELNEKVVDAGQYSSDGQVIIEEFYEGDEIQGLAWVNQGEAHVMYIGDRELVSIHKGRPGKPKRLYYPSKHLYEYEDEIKKIYQKIADAFGIKDGPLYVQMLVGREGIKVNEMMTRLPGGCDYLGIKEITGYDVGNLIIDFAIGNEINFDEIRRLTLMNLHSNLFVIPIYLKEGIVGNIQGVKELEKYNWVKEIFCSVLEGSRIVGTGDMKQDCGRVFATAKNKFDAREKVKIIHNALKITDDDNNNMIENFIRI